MAFVGARSAGVGKKSQAYKDGYDIGRNYEDETGSHLSSAQECGDTASAMLMQGTYSSDDLPDWTKGCQDGYADLLKSYGGN